MAFSIESTIPMCLEDCDRRIAQAESQIVAWDRNEYVLSQMERLAHTKEEEGLCDKLRPELAVKQNWENNLKLIRVEKLIYTSLTHYGNNALFPRLLAKYDELMRESYELVGDRVQDGLKEQLYLHYCSKSLKQREYIKAMCDYGMAR